MQEVCVWESAAGGGGLMCTYCTRLSAPSCLQPHQGFPQRHWAGLRAQTGQHFSDYK